MFFNSIQKETKNTHGKSGGFGLIEILVASVILSGVLLAVSSFYQNSLGISQMTNERVTAAFLMEEGLEAVKLMRDNSWSDIEGLATSTPLYYSWTGNTWATTTTNVYIDGLYERSFIVNDVYRDVNDDIVSSGGTLDTKIKLVTVSVSWNRKGATTTQEMSTYIADLFN